MSGPDPVPVVGGIRYRLADPGARHDRQSSCTEQTVMTTSPCPCYLQVAIHRPVDRLFDYACTLEPVPVPGQRVRLHFGRRPEIGLVLAVRATPDIDPARIRPIEAVLDPEPLLPPALLELLHFTARYYHHPLGETVLGVLPPALRKGQPLPTTVTPGAEARWQSTLTGTPPPTGTLPRPFRRPSGVRQQAILQALAAGEALSLAELCAATGLQLRVVELERLGARGDVQILHGQAGSPAAALETTMVGSGEPRSGTVPVAAAASPLPPLTAEQQQVLQELRGQPPGFQVTLLEGVTGSGKTEIYLETARAMVATQRQVLLLVPEIALTPQLIARVETCFPGQVGALHSSLPDGERLRVWAAARRGQLAVVLGTRSALFTPLARPGLLIVDEEHDAAYKQTEGLRYHARDLAVKRGQLENIPVLLGSATPTLESLVHARAGRYQYLRLRTRPDGSLPPRITCIDTRVHRLDEGLSRPLLDALQTTLTKGQQGFLLLNRRGYARVLTCASCGWIADCPHCDAHLTVHTAEPRTLCHLCGFQQPLPPACPVCATQLGRHGVGTQRLERALHRHFPDYPLERLDRDSTRQRGALAGCLQRIRTMGPGLVVGTQMLAQGHDFPRVGLVGVLEIDQGLFRVDLRAAEHTLQLVLQAAGRAGRGGEGSQVLVQTGHPGHPLLQALVQGDLDTLRERLLSERRDSGMPPFGHLALLRIEGPDAPACTQRAADIVQLLREHAADVRVLGPAPAPHYRVNNRYREQILLHSTRRDRLHAAVRYGRRQWQDWTWSRPLRIQIDMDPISLG